MVSSIRKFQACDTQAPRGLKMTVPCGGTGVSEENETLRVKSGEYESSDSGAFLLSVASQRSTTELL